MKRLLYRFAACGLLAILTGPALADYDFTALDVPGATETFADGINAFGQIVGAYTAGGTTHSFLLSEGEYIKLDSRTGWRPGRRQG
jgi:probable HAF family extracellular repeat protein